MWRRIRSITILIGTRASWVSKMNEVSPKWHSIHSSDSQLSVTATKTIEPRSVPQNMKWMVRIILKNGSLYATIYQIHLWAIGTRLNEFRFVLLLMSPATSPTDSLIRIWGSQLQFREMIVKRTIWGPTRAKRQQILLIRAKTCQMARSGHLSMPRRHKSLLLLHLNRNVAQTTPVKRNKTIWRWTNQISYQINRPNNCRKYKRCLSSLQKIRQMKHSALLRSPKKKKRCRSKASIWILLIWKYCLHKRKQSHQKRRSHLSICRLSRPSRSAASTRGVFPPISRTTTISRVKPFTRKRRPRCLTSYPTKRWTTCIKWIIRSDKRRRIQMTSRTRFRPRKARMQARRSESITKPLNSRMIFPWRITIKEAIWTWRRR